MEVMDIFSYLENPLVNNKLCSVCVCISLEMELTGNKQASKPSLMDSKSCFTFKWPGHVKQFPSYFVDQGFRPDLACTLKWTKAKVRIQIISLHNLH